MAKFPLEINHAGVYTGAVGSAYALHCVSSDSSIYDELERLRKAAKLLFDEVLKHFPEIIDEKVRTGELFLIVWLFW